MEWISQLSQLRTVCYSGEKNQHLQYGNNLTLIQRCPLSGGIFPIGLNCTFPQKSALNEILYVQLPRLNIAGIQSASVSCSIHSHWMISLFCPDFSKILIAYSPLQTKAQTKQDPLSLLLLVANGLRSTNLLVPHLFDKQLEKAHYFRQQLLFHICCKQQVSRGMHCPSPFLGSSKALLCATSMLLFTGCNVGCPGKPQSQR